VVSISTKVKDPLASESGGLSYSPLCVGADGKVAEFSRWFDRRQLSQLTKAFVVWQVAPVIAAQKHLAGVSKKLDSWDFHSPSG
jgi:hypothetical protein